MVSHRGVAGGRGKPQAIQEHRVQQQEARVKLRHFFFQQINGLFQPRHRVSGFLRAMLYQSW